MYTPLDGPGEPGEDTSVAVLSYLRFSVRPEYAAVFERDLEAAAQAARRAPGAAWVEVLRHPAGAHTYVVLSEWEDAARMQAWEQTPLHERMVLEHRPHFSAPAVIRRYRSYL
ncbi:MAG: antibiotic biosynthesis monooxygenase [Chloroflexi bacterium]|nr:antibiotic biosynthesis monooxygenase [Chloroflexota bacterium]